MAEHDLVIRGGNVVDGTGAPARTADVAVDDGVITEVGTVDGTGTRELDADGLLVTPGWVDIHTHYDGQVTWDPEMTPSSWHGVTTVVMGNCGVGFAPVRPRARRRSSSSSWKASRTSPARPSHEGIDWDWETFAEYLDALDGTPRVLDVAAQVPHAAVRAYVMGERAHERGHARRRSTRWPRWSRRAMRAGAVGFTTSRTILHRSKHGLVPGTTAPLDELLRARPTPSAPPGTASSRSSTTPSPRAATTTSSSSWRRAPARSPTPWPRPGSRPRRTWRPCSTPTTTPRPGAPSSPRCSNRPTGMLFGLQSSLHPFTTHPTYRAMATQPLAERVARLRDPEVRAALLAEEPATRNRIAVSLMQRWDQIFPLGDDPDYEPLPSTSVAAVAAAIGPHAAGGRARLAARA